MTNTTQIKQSAIDNLNIADLVKRYEFITQNTRDIIFTIRYSDMRIIEANIAAIKTYQYSLAEFKLMTLNDLLSKESQPSIESQSGTDLSAGIFFESMHIKKNGETFQVEVSSQAGIMGNERIIISVVRDISERKKTEKQLQESDNNLRALFNAVTESFFLTDKEGIVLAANETFAKRLRISLDKLIGINVYDLMTPEIAKQRRLQANHVIQTGKPARFEDIRNHRYIDQVIYPIFDSKGKVVRMAVFGNDITMRRQIEKELEEMAFTDQLTGLYNRRGFFSLAQRELRRAERSKRKMMLFFADLDDMKWINDHYGHMEGDRSLISASKILTQTFRASDIISRIGGDEFAILAVDADEIILDTLLGRFHKFISYLNSRKGQIYKISISIGHAIYDPRLPKSLDDLISEADRAMYKKKNLKKK
jgi:diguanylate cyclase (GGDEF)-like protein/PAS domain S-box-containing protein